MAAADERGGAAGAAWYEVKRPVASSWQVDFWFRTPTPPTQHPDDNHGLAFVIQNDARRTLALGCHGPAAATAPTSPNSRRATAASAAPLRSRCRPPTSPLALVVGGARPAREPQLRDGYRLDDGRPHHVRLRYIHAHPRNAIVYLDDMTHAALLSGHNMSVTEEFDLGAIADADGAAYVGFTATSGYETAAEHEVLEWHMS